MEVCTLYMMKLRWKCNYFSLPDTQSFSPSLCHPDMCTVLASEPCCDTHLTLTFCISHVLDARTNQTISIEFKTTGFARQLTKNRLLSCLRPAWSNSKAHNVFYSFYNSIIWLNRGSLNFRNKNFFRFLHRNTIRNIQANTAWASAHFIRKCIARLPLILPYPITVPLLMSH